MTHTTNDVRKLFSGYIDNLKSSPLFLVRSTMFLPSYIVRELSSNLLDLLS